MGSWVHGFMGSWVHGFMGSWVFGSFVLVLGLPFMSSNAKNKSQNKWAVSSVLTIGQH
jgi:hypothetical protein